MSISNKALIVNMIKEKSALNFVEGSPMTMTEFAVWPRSGSLWPAMPVIQYLME